MSMVTFQLGSGRSAGGGGPLHAALCWLRVRLELLSGLAMGTCNDTCSVVGLDGAGRKVTRTLRSGGASTLARFVRVS